MWTSRGDRIDRGIEQAQDDGRRFPAEPVTVQLQSSLDRVSDLREERRGSLLQRRLVAGHTVGEAGEAAGAQPLRREQRQEAAQAGAGKALVGVGRIAREGEPVRPAISHEVGLRKGQEGARQPDAGRQRALTPHPGEAGRAASRDQPHQHRLGLIVEGMGREDEAGPDRRGVVGQQVVAGGAGCLLETAAAARRVPGQDRMGKSHPGGEQPDRPRLFARARAEAVIDRRNVQPHRAPGTGRRMHQSRRIGPA